MTGRSRTVAPARTPLAARLRVPGDKSIAHRAVLFNAAARGRAVVRGLPDGADVASTIRAVESLGCRVVRAEGGALSIEGRDFRFAPPTGVIDCGNSGTTMRLVMGVLAGQSFRAVLDGDDSLRRRPMERVARPLRRMGASIDTTDGKAPVTVAGGGLHGAVHRLEVASAQVKSALMLAGLQADGGTEIHEPSPTRDHSERMLSAMGVAFDAVPGIVRLAGPARLQAIDVDVCGDASSSAFFVVAGCLVPGSDLTVEGVCLNPGRVGFLDVLRRMGARIDVARRGESAGEPFGDITVRAASLRATAIAPAEVPSCIDELPVLAVAAAAADGRTVIAGAEELRVKESDRIATVAAMLRELGVDVTETPDGMIIEGMDAGRRFRGGCTIASAGDHRIAMAGGVAALAADAEVVIDDAAAATISFPRFFDLLDEART
jgi:3-phosphoshikimate 1-carboxyvinyltransferase